MPPFLQKIIDKSPFLTKVYEILDLYGSRRMGRSAAAFAYYLMLSFFPLLICVASIIGRTRIDIGELLELLSEELGVPMADLTKGGGESRLLAGRTKEVLS